MIYQTTKLRNGIRVATCEMPQMKSVSVGVWVAVGGRHEQEEHCGISHFVEHLLFKGTKTRSAQSLTEEVEGVGGFINAFTTEDHTCFYSRRDFDVSGSARTIFSRVIKRRDVAEPRFGPAADRFVGIDRPDPTGRSTAVY